MPQSRNHTNVFPWFPLQPHKPLIRINRNSFGPIKTSILDPRLHQRRRRHKVLPPPTPVTINLFISTQPHLRRAVRSHIHLVMMRIVVLVLVTSSAARRLEVDAHRAAEA